MIESINNASKLPRHIAIIPDGNRRWAKQHSLSPWVGHRKGSETLENLLEILDDFDIPYFSFWGSSQDNLTKRPREEVDFLLSLFKEQFPHLAENEKIHDNGIRINIYGSWREQFPEDVKRAMESAIEATKDYDKHHLNFFIAYSGTDEMLQAAKKIAELKIENPALAIDEALLKSQLLTKDLPPVDLLVRTGGEPHNSDGFMMWDVADAQLFFSDKLYPDFTKEDLEGAIKEYSSRERRLGK